MKYRCFASIFYSKTKKLKVFQLEVGGFRGRSPPIYLRVKTKEEKGEAFLALSLNDIE